MYCPVCGRSMALPPGRSLPYPMHSCAVDGVVYDVRRQRWYGLPDLREGVYCPLCGSAMEGGASADEPPKLLFCYQCGVTLDRSQSVWYGLVGHFPPSEEESPGPPRVERNP